MQINKCQLRTKVHYNPVDMWERPEIKCEMGSEILREKNNIFVKGIFKRY